MKYTEIRGLIKSGDVIAYKHKIVPWRSFYDFKIFLIRLFNTTDITHVGTVHLDGDRVMLLEAVSKGVRAEPLSMKEDFIWIPRGIWSDEHLKRAMSKMGQPYSYWECGLTLFKRLKMDSGSWQCAKYLCYVLDINLEHMTPETVVDYLTEQESLLPWSITTKE